jgi:beta-alanine degradation protein BauB
MKMPNKYCPDRAPKMGRRDILRIIAAIGAVAAAPAAGQDATKVNPRGFKVVFENDKLRVLEYRSRPGLGICGQGRHFHPAHLTIQLTDCKVKVVKAGKTVLAEGKAGDMFWEPQGWHTVENIGGAEARAYMVELKDAAWKPSTG